MKPGRDGSDFSRFLRHLTRTEWGTQSTENSRVGTPTQGSSSFVRRRGSAATSRPSHGRARRWGRRA
eukprot:3600050-Prymnesium_polylepis.1